MSDYFDAFNTSDETKMETPIKQTTQASDELLEESKQAAEETKAEVKE